VIAVMKRDSTIGREHPAFLGTNKYLGSSYFYMSGTSAAQLHRRKLRPQAADRARK
jgi:hypothetical protein